MQLGAATGPRRLARTDGSWTPIRMKTVPLMRNSRTCQAAAPATPDRRAHRARRVPPDVDARRDRREDAGDARTARRGGRPRPATRNVSTTEKTGSSTRRRTHAIDACRRAARTRRRRRRRATNVRPALGQRERPGHGGDDRDPVRDERRRVVDEALALEDRDDPARDAEPLEDRRRGHGVGRRDDRPEGERGRPAEPRDERLGDDGDDDGRDQDEPDRQETDRPEVAPEVADRGEVAGPEQDRRQEQQEDEVGLELDRRAGPGTNPRASPPSDEQDRVRDADAGGRAIASAVAARSRTRTASMAPTVADSAPPSVRCAADRRSRGRRPPLAGSRNSTSIGSIGSAGRKPKTWP